MPRHYMLDIETLGTKPGCVVLEYALRHFLNEDEDSGVYSVVSGAITHVRIDIDAQVKAGAVIDFDTLKWWLNTDPLRLQNVVNEDDVQTPTFAANWLQDSFYWQSITIWARDPDFDCAIMEDFYSRFGKPGKRIWHFANKRSHRTIIDLAGIKHIPALDAHSAVADVDAQIESAIKALRILTPERFNDDQTEHS